MADEAEPRQPRQNLTPPGLRPRRETAGRWALILSAVWLVLIGAYAIGFFIGGAAPDAARPQGLTVLLFLLGAVGPVALFGFAALMLERAEALRSEIAALRGAGAPAAETGEGRFARQAAEQAKASAARLAAIEATLAAIAARLDAGEPGTPSAARRTGPQLQAAPADQPALPLGDATAPTPRIPWSDIVRALDFPRNADDAAGFDAVRSAIRDPEIARLLQAAEDVLGLLAADGLHMEDFIPDHASLAAWRAYGEGARGARAAAIGGIQDPEAVERVRSRLRADAIFRDATLVLVRRWNALIARVLGEMGEDPLLRDLADTRSGRAFMLTARATGAFD